MTRHTFHYLLSILLLFSACASVAWAEESDSILSNGDFETEKDGGPVGWSVRDGVTWEEEDGNHFLRLTQQEPNKMLLTYRLIILPEEHKAYILKFRARANAIQRGKKLWHDGRIMMDFKNADGKKVGPKPNAPYFKGSTDGWVTKTVEFLVPEDATQLEFMPALFNIKSGSLDLDDIQLIPADPEPIIKKREEAKAKKQAEIARRAALVKPQVPVAPADKLPPTLKVVGNKLKTPDGKNVWLQGVALASMEWSAGGDNILKSTEVAIADWNVNCIRLGIREHFWAGTGPYQKDGGAAYRQLVDDVVNYSAARGVYVVLDLHRFRAPREEHAEFWRKVATKYKDHPAVLFELFNEPHDISWEVWRDGGRVTTEKKKTDAVAENTQKLKGFDSVGMQGLLDAVRETGAKNIVIAGGLDWGYDLSGVLNGYALNDRGGNGIMYSSHVYPWKSNWQKKFLCVAEKYPLFIGETGCQVERMPFIPESQHEDPYTWAPDMLGLIQKYKLNWTAWCFHPRSSPCVLADWDYTPTPYWGEFVKKALAGEKFTMKKMR